MTIAYRFEARSTTPGDWRFKTAAAAVLLTPPFVPGGESRLRMIAKALAGLLVAAGFPAEESLRPRRKLEDYSTLRITVVGRADESEDGSRSTRLRTYTVDVAYQQRLSATTEATEAEQLAIDTTETDAHEGAIESLIDVLNDLTTIDGARIIDVDRYAGDEAPYSMRNLTEHRLYTAVVKVTLEEYREVA